MDLLKVKSNKKRYRTSFTTEQVEVLELQYKTNNFIKKEKRKILTDLLGIEDRAIKVWFQNRRMKDKKINEESEVQVRKCEFAIEVEL